MKIGIIGMGSVGATIAYSIAVEGIAHQLILCDRTEEKAIGEAMDLQHCASFIPPVDIEGGGIGICRNMDIVIITAGVKRHAGEHRTDLIRRNLIIFEELAHILPAENPNAIFIVVSNPVDLLTLFLLRKSGLPKNQIIGSGTLLDTSRFRHLLSNTFHVDPRNIHAYIIGEHGPGSVPLWSHAYVGAVPMDEYARQLNLTFSADDKDQILNDVLKAGQNVIERKGATYYGIAQTVIRILTAIQRDESSVLTVSTDTQGFGGITDIALSLPMIVGRKGIEHSAVPPLTSQEMALFQTAARSIQNLARELAI